MSIKSNISGLLRKMNLLSFAEKARFYLQKIKHKKDNNAFRKECLDFVLPPDFFIYDKDLKLVYRGQLDDSRPGNEIPVTGKDIRHALDCLINDQPLPELQRPSIGCNIKWK